MRKDYGNSDSLWHDRNFHRFWAAITVAGIGSQVTLLAIPLAAVAGLGVKAFQLSILTAIQLAPVLFLSPIAGVVTDRFPARFVNAGCDITRGIVLLGIPILAALHSLAFVNLCVLAGVAGCFKFLSGVAHYSMLPRLVSREKIAPGNAAVSTSYSVTEVAGPGVAGLLIQAFTAPYALVVDSIALMMSGGLLVSLNTRHGGPRVTGQRWLTMIRDGFAYLKSESALLMLGLSGGITNVFMGSYETIIVFYLVRTLHFHATSIGFLYMAGAVGGIAGAVLAQRAGRRFSEVRAMIGSTVMSATGMFTVAAAALAVSSPVRFVPVTAGILLYSFGLGVYNVHAMSARQTICPPEMLGRLTASYSFLSQGSLPLGALLGGVIATALGPATAIALAGLGVITWMALVRFTPFNQLSYQLAAQAEPEASDQTAIRADEAPA